MTKLEHNIREESQTIRRSETWSANIQGFECVVICESDGTHRISIYHLGETNRLRLGLVQCTPRTVCDIETFATVSADLFRELAESLRAVGKDDLRSGHERMMDEMQDRTRKAVG